jgi:YfiH family protein
MIRPEGFRGAAFGTLTEGDLRFDEAGRRRISRRLGIPSAWAFVTQVHGSRVVVVDTPGLKAEADAILTATAGLPVAVATADCVPVVLEGDGVAAVVHVGWRGAAAGVIPATLRALRDHDRVVTRAAVGPAIGPGCYEVGDEVAAHFPGFVTRTTWGTQSIDLPGIVTSALDGLDVWQSGICTYTDRAFASYRRNRTDLRQVAVAWLPTA